jgi:hypothetical protein
MVSVLVLIAESVREAFQGNLEVAASDSRTLANSDRRIGDA